MKLRLILLFAALPAMLALVEPVHAQRNLNVAAAPANEQRVALVIGNSAYKEAPLRNPVNDATDMAATLRSLGFAVTLRTNADTRQMRTAIREFAQNLKRGGVGLFYFAGHGVQSRNGRNYLIPVGADLKEEFELEDEAVDANRVLAGMEEAGNRVNIVILDACRNNPFARSWRSAANGLAQMSAPTGSFVAFATAPGSVAADGSGRNGTYTKHLLENLKAGDPDIDRVFTRVTAAVAKETGNKQVPWKSSSLTGDFFFRRPDSQPYDAAAEAPAVPITRPVPDVTFELTFWQSVENSNSAADYTAYLNRFPEGQFVELARNRLAQLSANVQIASVVPSAAQIKRGPVTAPALPKVGDFWRYRGSNQNGPDSPTYRVTRVMAGTIELRFVSNKNEQMVNVLNSDWNPLSEEGQEHVGTLRYVPFVAKYQFPLEPGKKWRAHFRGECGMLCSFEVDSESEVRGWERITVPAGTFDALKIDSRDTFKHLFGVTSVGTGSIWLAPEVKRPVKFDYTHSGKRINDYELEAYQIAK